MLADEELDRQVKPITVLGDIVGVKVERGKDSGSEEMLFDARDVVVREGSVGMVIKLENFEWGE